MEKGGCRRRRDETAAADDPGIRPARGVAAVRLLLAAFLALAASGSALADSCAKSRDYILDSTDLPQRPQTYRTLFKVCLQTLELSNVQDAFVLKTGGIAIVPRNDSISATASTLAQFCTRFPKGHAHFVGRKERRRMARISSAVEFGAVRSTPCAQIMGGG